MSRAARGPQRAKLVWGGVLLFSLLALGQPAEADTLQDQFLRASQAFYSHDVERAIQGYRELVESGVDDPDVSYDLGTAYARLGRHGRAIQFYERALRQRPDDEDVRHNLRLVRSQLARKLVASHLEASVEERPPFFRALADGLTSDAVAVTFLFSYLAFFSLVFARRMAHQEVSRLAVGIALAVMALMTVASGALFATKVWTDHGAHEAIIVAEEAHGSTGPGADFEESFSLVEGTRVRVLGREGTWVLVRGPEGREGWLPRKDVGSI
ncbi:MAG: tetratricopeptide repeat protein [Deltaproteobacteria bacterium]|nr:tetratricopeptide repeat protein [Deltaproteobacteria bacterium]